MRLTRLVVVITTLAVLIAACVLARQENTSSGTAQPTATVGAATTAGHPAATATPPVEPTAAPAQPTATPAEPSAGGRAYRRASAANTARNRGSGGDPNGGCTVDTDRAG
jgi:predicted lipid-binding transport protein (Tim44 family)